MLRILSRRERAGGDAGPPTRRVSHPTVTLSGMNDIPAPLLALARGQRGHVTRWQAHDHGVSDRRLRVWIAHGIADRTGANTVRFAGAPAGAIADLWGLMLDVGGDAWASGPTAAALHGFDGFALRPPFHVTIARGRSVTRLGHRIHTTAVLPLIDRCVAGELPCTSAARTLIDLARSESAERLTIAYDSGLRDGRFNESLVHRRIVALREKGRFGIPKLLRVIDGCEIVRGGHSWLEREFLRLVAAAGLPRPDTQVVLGRAGDRKVRVDFRFPGTPVVVEVLGYRFHRSPSELRRDAQRMNRLVLDGFRPMQFTYEQVVDEPAVMITGVADALSVSNDDRFRRCG